MHAWISLAVTLVACRSESPPASRSEPPRDAAIAIPVDAAAVAITKLASIDPRQLGADDYADRILDRAYIRGTAGAALSPDAPIPPDATREPSEVHPVLARTGDRLQIVLERHGFRVALWVALADALPAIVTPTRLVVDGAPPDDPHGVDLEPGAYAELETGSDGRVTVEIDREVRANGSIPSTAIGPVWRHQPLAHPPRFRGPADRVTDAPPLQRLVRGGTALRLAPAATARVIATVDADEDHAGLHARRAGWLDIELRFDRYRVRGWIRDRDTRPRPADRGHGYGIGGASASPWFCLYGAAAGEIVGVGRPSVAESARVLASGFAETTLETPFGELVLWLRATPNAAHPYEVCP